MTTRIGDRLDHYAVTRCLVRGREDEHSHRTMLEVIAGRYSARCVCGWTTEGETIPEAVTRMAEHT